MARNTFTAKSVSTVFIVRNTALSRKNIRVFGLSLGWGRSYDLLTIPDISESDIRHSLLKGELKRKADAGEIRVTSSTIDLTQFDSEQKTFLQSLGISSGIASAPDATINISELSVLDDLLLADGSPVFIRTVLDWFTLIKESTVSVDDITVISTKSSIGRWHREGLPHDYWRRQITWFMDSINGNDENVGNTDATPIKTFAEFRRRHGKLLGSPGAPLANITLTILDTGNVVENFIVDMHARLYPEEFTLQGTVTAPLYSGSVTGYVPSNPGAQQEPLLTDAALPVSWTASGLIHKQMILTSGANIGATAYISTDVGAKTALMPLFLSTAFVVVEPTIGDTFDVFDETTIKGTVEIDIGESWANLRNIQIDASGTFFDNELVVTSASVVNLIGCATLGTNTNNSRVNQGQLSFLGGMMASDHGCIVKNAFVLSLATLFTGGRLYASQGAIAELAYCTFDASGQITISANGVVLVNDDTMFVNCGAAIPAELATGALLKLTALMWGTTGNTPTYAFSLSNMSTIVADVENLQIMGSTTNDILLGSTGVDYDETRPMEDGYSGAKVFDSYP